MGQRPGKVPAAACTAAARAGARGRQAAFGALRAEALLCPGELAEAEQEADAAAGP